MLSGQQAHRVGSQSGTVELDLPPGVYAPGKTMTIVVTASVGDQTVGQSTKSGVPLSPGCTLLSMELDDNDIVAGADLSTMAPPDFMAALPDLTPADCSSCPNSCDTTTSPPSCQHLVPSGPVLRSDFQLSGLSAQSVTSDIVINSDTGAISGGLTRAAGSGVIGGIGFRVATQVNGPSVGVFSVAGFIVVKAATVSVTGANAFALASTGTVMLDGTLDGACHNGNIGSSGALVPGPGGFAGGGPTVNGGSGLGSGSVGASGASSASGGGGGGYGDAGGKGASGPTLATSAGGGINGDLTADSFVLAGGSGGSVGGKASGSAIGGIGGSGGGALQLSVDGDVTISGSITVGGCGGGDASGGGGGGGAGGAIVIESAHIALATSSVLAANGGGGGGGGTTAAAGSGSAGAASTVSAPAGVGGSAGGNGGNGGASNGHPGLHFTQGADAPVLTGSMAMGGGGGGGCGRIALRTVNGANLDDQSTAVTPDLTDTNANGTHPTSFGVARFQ
jgi:hypothetical protein